MTIRVATISTIPTGRAIQAVFTNPATAIFSHGAYKQDVLTNYFDEVMENTKFTRWYFGHYHDDKTIMGKFIMLYDSFERVV